MGFKYKSIIPVDFIDHHLMSSILLDKLEEMKDAHADIWLPDKSCKIYDKEEVKKFLSLDETDKIPKKEEESDCDDFAAKLYGKFAGLVWTTVHALNWFVSENHELYFIEPQQDKLSQNLEDWQGWDVQFFIGR